MGLYERLLEEHEEEQRRGRALDEFSSLDSPALDRLLAGAPGERPKKYGADLRKLHRYITKAVYSPGE